MYSCFVEFWSPTKCGGARPVVLLKKKNRVKVFSHISYSGPFRQGIRIIRYMEILFFDVCKYIYTYLIQVRFELSLFKKLLSVPFLYLSSDSLNEERCRIGYVWGTSIRLGVTTFVRTKIEHIIHVCLKPIIYYNIIFFLKFNTRLFYQYLLIFKTTLISADPKFCEIQDKIIFYFDIHFVFIIIS